MSIQQDNENTPIKTCKICCKAVSRYNCPKCHIPYCSLTCYKSKDHEGCSEHFYKDCFMSELSRMKAGGDEKKKMLAMLEKFEKDDLKNSTIDVNDGIDDRTYSDDDDDDDDDAEDIEERFKDFNIDDSDINDISDLLRAKELQQFNKQLQSGVALENLPELKPWWCEHKNKNAKIKIPQKMKNIKPLKELIKGDVSSNIPFDIVNLLFSYCYLYRLHHGLISDLPVLFSMDLIRLSLGSSISFVDVDMAICDALYKLSNECHDLHENDEFTSNVIDDCLRLVHANRVESLASNALSDIAKTMKACKRDPTEYNDLDSKQKQDIKKAMMKINFYLSWINDHGESLYILTEHLSNINEKFSKELRNKNELRKFISTNRNKLNTQKKIVDIDTK